MKSPLLSIIIALYNSEEYIERCIKSIVEQTYNNLEIIIINDGSTDESLKICEQFQEKDKRIKIYNQKNTGVSSARNTGIAKATGDYITFVDSDDYLIKEAYEKALKQIDGNDCVFFSYSELFENSNYKRIIIPKKTGIVDHDEAIYQCILPIGDGYFTSVWNKIFKTDIVKRSKFDEECYIGEDELWLAQNMSRFNRIVLLNEPLYIYCQRDESVLHSDKKMNVKWRSAINAKKKVLKTFNSGKCLNLYKAKYYNDLFDLKWYAYINRDDNYQELNKELRQYAVSFYCSKEYSLRKKIKYLLIDFLLIIKAPGSIIRKIGKTTHVKLKMRINEFMNTKNDEKE